MLIALLEELGLTILKDAVPIIGAAVVAGIAGLVKRFADNNPDHPDAVKGVSDVAGLASAVVDEVDQLDFGAIFSEDEQHELKFKTAVRDLIGRAAARGVMLLENDAGLLIKHILEARKAGVPHNVLAGAAST
jgi:hypothetical protein